MANGSKRELRWITVKANYLTTAGINQVFDLMPGETSRKGFTVTRCVISWTLKHPSVDTEVAWGTLVVPENLPDVNIPNPRTPENAGWLCWDLVELQFDDPRSLTRQYDIRSMRRFRSDEEDLKLIINSEASVDGLFGVRTLFALP